MKRIISVLALLCLLIGVWWIWKNPNIGFAEKEGNINAERVVSLVPSVTKCIYELGEQDKLVGCTSYCKVNPADSIAVVGSAIKANLEKIMTLAPTMVIASPLIPQEEVHVLRNMGVRVEQISSPDSYADLQAQFTRLGELLGVAPRAQHIVDSVNVEVNKIVTENATANSLKVFVQIAADPIYTITTNTYLADLLPMLHATNAIPNTPNGMVSPEAVVAQNPDVIFIATMGFATEPEIERWNSFNNMVAAHRRQIYTLNADTLCEPTPLNYLYSLQRMDAILRPLRLKK